MRNIRFLLIALLGASFPATAQYSLQGTVTGPDGKPVSGAFISLSGTYLGTATAADGSYRLQQLKEPDALVEVKALGYISRQKRVDLSKESTVDWQLEFRSFLADEVVVTATRADDKSGMAYTTLDKDEIAKRNLGQDLPFLLNTQPSVVITSDAGAGVGYTGIRVRGSDPTRTNVTINGIPINDAESHGMYWVNMPDMASSANSIQLQRGVGTSTNGAGAFGATLNMQTNEFKGEPYASITTGGGSFNTFRNTVQAGTGLIKGFTFDVRLSKITSDGYIDRASSDLKSYFLSGAWYKGKTTLRANVFSGIEKTYQAWDGVPQDSLTTNRTYNPTGSYWDVNGKERFYHNETDNYQQDHYQLFFNREMSRNLLLNVALHYTRGRGYFEQYKQDEDLADYGAGNMISSGDTVTTTDLIRRRWLDNHFYGTVFSATWTPSNRLRVIAGGGLNRYDGLHYGEVIWAQYAVDLPHKTRYYQDTAQKTDFNFYTKVNYELLPVLNLFADLQYRRVDYSFYGFNSLLQHMQQDIQLHFFNPKGGITWDISDRQRLFASFSIGNREPVRDDYRYSSPASRPRPEQMQDTELGYRLKSRKVQAGLTAYYMNYKDQLVLTGQINDVGEYTRINTPESYRAGLEFELGWAVLSRLTWTGNVTYSRNKIKAFTEYVFDYESYIEQAFSYSNTDISFSPSVIASSTFSWKPLNSLELSLISKYVGDQYLDNTQSEERKLDAFFVNDFRLNFTPRYAKAPLVEIGFLLNNIFDVKYAPHGYTYSGLYGTTRSNYNFYYPQAGRNFLAMLKLSF